MLRVYYSNRTEALVRALVASVEEHRRGTRASLFDPTYLVVPNRNMETYLKLEIARLTGICAHFEVLVPKELIEKTASRVVETGTVADARTLHGRILTALFDGALLEHEELGPVRDYLQAAGTAGEAVDRRRVELASKLARLFEAYVVSRPDLLECWRAGLFQGDLETQPTERWQRRLWLGIDDGSLRMPFDVLKSSDPATLGLPARLHFFGISYMERGYLEVLGHLAKASSLYLYALNPCQEIWEAISEPLPLFAVPRRYERRSRDLGPGEVFSLVDPFRLENSGEMLPLRLWARPGRENLRLLNAITGCELVPRIEEPEPTTLLGSLQRDIALRKPERDSIPKGLDFTRDESIVFLECGNVRRELETIACEIWSLLEADDASHGEEPLRFNDIAVILTPSAATRYQALIGSVFAEAHRIPHNVVDLPVRGESRLVEAVELLLKLPLSRFTRYDVLGFVTHPTVMGSLPEADPDDWLHWCEALGVVHGADRRDHADTYIDKDLFNWDQGLKRLALGAFMSGERSGDERLFRTGSDDYLPEELSPDERANAAELGLFVRSLLADAKEAARVQMTLPAWMDFMSTFVTTYVPARAEHDERVLRKVLREIGALGRASLGGKKVRYRVAEALVRSAIARLSGARGHYLLDGVVVSSFLPMRAIPFEVIFLVGLGEGDFPATDVRDHLDLRLAHRRAGDVGPRDEDKYLFLETLLSARRKLYLSYVSRDEVTGDSLEPSSLVHELKETLTRSYLPEESLAVRKPSLRRYDDAAICRLLPEASRERNARALGEHLRTHLGAEGSTDVTALGERLPREVREMLSELAPPGAAEARTGPLSLSVAAVRQFLECPLQGSARFFLRLRDDDEEDVIDREDERFGAPALERAVLLREAFRRGGSAAEYDELARRFELKGAVPTGPFGASERRRHLEILSSWKKELARIANGDPVRLREDRNRPRPIVLTVDGRRVQVSGGRSLALESPRGSLRLLTQRRSRFHPERESLHGFLDHVFASAAGESPGAHYTFYVVNAPPSEAPRTAKFTFSPMDADTARDYLTALLREMLSGVHDYLLPCEAVFDFRKMGAVPAVSVERSSSRYGPVRNPEDYACPDEVAARAAIERRFGLYFATVEARES